MDDAPIQYEKADYSAILAKDSRYDRRAYDFVLEVMERAMEESKGRQVSGRFVLDAFRDLALDLYGPMAYAVMSDWGVRSCEDVGNIVFNLYDAKMIGKSDSDSRDDFFDGFDFKEEFLGPYAV